ERYAQSCHAQKCPWLLSPQRLALRKCRVVRQRSRKGVVDARPVDALGGQSRIDAQSGTTRSIACQLYGYALVGLRIRKRSQHPAFAMHDMLACSCIVKSYDGQAARHGLQRHVAKGFRGAGKQEEISRCVMRG